MEESIPKLGTECNYRKKMCFATKSCSTKHNWERVFVCAMLRNGILRVCFYFCSTELNSELFSLLWNGWNGIPSVFIYFCFTERNSELFSLSRNGLEWNSKSLPLFLFHKTEFQALFANWSCIKICIAWSKSFSLFVQQETLKLPHRQSLNYWL